MDNEKENVPFKLSEEAPRARARNLPLTIWILGFVSFFSNSASVIITALSPQFIIHILGGTPTDMGLIRGISESIAYFIKLVSGFLSDWLGKRKILILIGYLCAAFAKPMFAFSRGFGLYISAQLLERVTNGLRDTPRDALIADAAPKGMKGAAYGVRQSFAFGGSLIGAIACFFMLAKFGESADSVRLTYLIAAIPILIAVLLIYFGIKEPKIVALKNRKGFPIKKEDMKELGVEFWVFMLICFIFMCARYSESFLVYRAEELNLSMRYSPLVLAVMYVFNAPTAKLVGSWSDRKDRKVFLAFGFSMMLVSCIILMFATELWHVFLGVAAYGIHYGATQGTFYAMVADYSPPQIKGTSIGIFNLVCCVGMFFSNMITGWTWTHWGSEKTFLINSIITFIAVSGIILVKNYSHKDEMQRNGEASK